jgi:carbonic anhydrase
VCKLCDASPAPARAPVPMHAQPTRRKFMGSVVGVAMAAAVSRVSFAADPSAPPPKPQNVVSPRQALDRLMKGNQRYVEGVAKRHDFKAEREALVGGQNPFAAILSCADSRIAPEYAFDTGRGDLFVVRIAGNFATDDGIASFEYALQFLGTPLLVVLGHQRCGAVDAAIKSAAGAAMPGHIPSLVRGLEGAVKAAAGQPGDALNNAIKQNVVMTVAQLKNTAPIIAQFVAAKKVDIVGGIYNLDTGHIDLVA